MNRSFTLVAGLVLALSACTVGEGIEDPGQAPDGAVARGTRRLPGYLALGDSITFGVGASAAPNHIEQFRQWLEDEHFHGPVDHLNLAVPGATSEDILRDQVPRGLVFELQHLRTKKVISVASGGNDLLGFINSPDFAACASGDQATCQAALGAVLAEFEDNLDLTLRALRLLARDENAILMARTQSNGFVQASCSVNGAIDAQGNVFLPAQQVKGLIPLAFLALEGAVQDAAAADPFPGLNDIMRAKAAQYGAVVVDMLPPFLAASAAGQQVFTRDCIHPNDDGYALLTQLFIDAFENR